MESMYDMHHNFDGYFYKKKCALYMGKYGR